MLLKLKRGEKEEKFKVEVHKNDQGAFQFKQMEPDHHSWIIFQLMNDLLLVINLLLSRVE